MMITREELKVSLRNFTTGELMEELSHRHGVPSECTGTKITSSSDLAESAKQKYVEIFLSLADASGVKDGSSPNVLAQLHVMMEYIREF